MAYWRFSFAPLNEDQRDLLAEIPGFRFGGAKDHPSQLAAPENAAWLAVELLGALGIPYRTIPPPKFPGRDARLALPFLQEWVPAFLTSYQREGVKRILAIPGESGALWWSCGSGKTLAGLVWILARGAGYLSVVVTKAAICGHWEQQIETYCKHTSWSVLEGQSPSGSLGGVIPAGPLRSTATPTILIVSYDVLPYWISVLERLHPLSVIFDESQKVTSHKRWTAEVDTQTTEIDTGPEMDAASSAIVAGADMASVQVPLPDPKVTFSLKDNRAAAAYRLSRVARRRLSTTATPVRDRVMNLWAQLDLIHPWEWGAYWAWAKRYCAASEGRFGGMDDRGSSHLDELMRRCSFVAHRVKYSEANRELPPKRRLVTYIKVSEQARPLGGIKAELRAASARGRDALREALLMEAASRKRPIVLARAREYLEAGQKVCIFTGRRIDCERLTDDAEKLLIGKGAIENLTVWTGHGGDSPRARDLTQAGYMAAPGPAILIGTIDAWGEGLDLQDTDFGVMAMLPYTPAQIIQAEGRWARKGQKRDVLVWYPICEGTIDEHVATLLLAKLPAVEKDLGSDEIEGLGRELVGASEEELLKSLVAKVLGERIEP